jgi:hypothetical protein
MSTQYRLVQSGKTASGGCSAGPRFVRACSATDKKKQLCEYESFQNYWLSDFYRCAVGVGRADSTVALSGGGELDVMTTTWLYAALLCMQSEHSVSR